MAPKVTNWRSTITRAISPFESYCQKKTSPRKCRPILKGENFQKAERDITNQNILDLQNWRPRKKAVGTRKEMKICMLINIDEDDNAYIYMYCRDRQKTPQTIRIWCQRLQVGVLIDLLSFLLEPRPKRQCKSPKRQTLFQNTDKNTARGCMKCYGRYLVSLSVIRLPLHNGESP